MNINSLSVYSFEYEKIYVGFSGGADSTALLLLLQAAANSSSQNNFKFEAVHFEHGLRGDESLQDAQWCSDFCEVRKIPLKTVSFEMDPGCENLEAEARKRRLDYWKENINHENEAVALGHHADDTIENILMRLMRGSNCSGLTALRAVKIIDGVTILRPLLTYRRTEIEEFLKSQGITDWCEDSSNKEMKQQRNIIRNAVIPELKKHFPKYDKAFLKSLHALEEDADFLEMEAEKVFSRIKNLEKVEIAQLANLHPALLVRVMRLWLSSLIGKDFIPNSDFMQRLKEDFAKFTNPNTSHGERKTIPLLNSCALVCEKGMLGFEKNFETMLMSLSMIVWNWRKKTKIKYGDYEFTAFLTDSLEKTFFNERLHNIVCFNVNDFPDTVIIRDREPGDEMIPFHRNSEVKVKKLLEDTALLTAQKRNIPVLTDPEGKIFWIPGVRRAEFANIEVNETQSTQQGNFIILKSELIESS